MEKLLDKLIELLEEEKNLIINAINSSEATEKLNKLIEEKKEILLKISQLDEKSININEKIKEKVEKIKLLLKTNEMLALSNLNFIEEIFESVFSSHSTYGSEGEVKKIQGNIINKKI